MKRVLLGVAALAAMTGAAGVAHADTTGYADLSYRHLDPDSGDDANAVAIGGAVVAPLSGAWNAQFDANFDRVDSDSVDFTESAGAVHAYYTDGAWKLGGELGVTNVFSEGIYSFGIDGQYNFSTVSLTGQVAYDNADNGGGNDWTASVEGKWFATDNFAPALHYTHLSSDDNGFVGSDANLYGVGVEYKFDASPVSLFADYTKVDFDDSSIDDSNVWTIGARWNFGDGTLHDRQNTGPSLISNVLGFIA